MTETIELDGSTDVVHSYTSGRNGGSITVNLVARPNLTEKIYIDFEEPDGVEVYEVNGALKTENKWKLLRNSSDYVRNITFRFRRNSERDEIKEQNITVSVTCGGTVVNDITFTING